MLEYMLYPNFGTPVASATSVPQQRAYSRTLEPFSARRSRIEVSSAPRFIHSRGAGGGILQPIRVHCGLPKHSAVLTTNARCAGTIPLDSPLASLRSSAGDPLSPSRYFLNCFKIVDVTEQQSGVLRLPVRYRTGTRRASVCATEG